MDKNSKIYISGHTGLVGSSIMRILKKEGYNNLIYRSIDELNLIHYDKVENFFKTERPEYVFVASAKVGGIFANKTRKAEFIFENLQIQNNIIHNSYLYNVKKLLFLGSSCIYPKLCPQPMKEEYLLSGYLEETNDAYAIAKIAGIKLCQSYNEQYKTNFISAMPTNLYGINDNFNLESSHVLPARIRIFHEAKINNLDRVTVWGTGMPRREFLFVDDLAEALLFLMNNYNDSEIINVGTGADVTIAELVDLIKKITGYSGKIEYDTSKPDGTPQKLLDVTKLNNLGWKAMTSLEEGIKKTYEWFSENYENITRK